MEAAQKEMILFLAQLHPRAAAMEAEPLLEALEALEAAERAGTTLAR